MKIKHIIKIAFVAITLAFPHFLKAQCEEIPDEIIGAKAFCQRNCFKSAFPGSSQQQSIIKLKDKIDASIKSINDQLAKIEKNKTTPDNQTTKKKDKKKDNPLVNVVNQYYAFFIASDSLVSKYYSMEVVNAITYKKEKDDREGRKETKDNTSIFLTNSKKEAKSHTTIQGKVAEIKSKKDNQIENQIDDLKKLATNQQTVIDNFETIYTDIFNDDSPQKNKKRNDEIKLKRAAYQNEVKKYEERTDSLFDISSKTTQRHKAWYDKISTNEEIKKRNKQIIDSLKARNESIPIEINALSSNKDNKAEIDDLRLEQARNIADIKDYEKDNGKLDEDGLALISGNVKSELNNLDRNYNYLKNEFKNLNRSGNISGLENVLANEKELYRQLTEARKSLDIAVFLGNCLPPRHIVYFNLTKANLILSDIQDEVDKVVQENYLLFQPTEPFVLNCGTETKDKSDNTTQPSKQKSTSQTVQNNNGTKSYTNASSKSGDDNKLGIIFKVELFTTDQIAPTSTFKGLTSITSENSGKGGITYYSGRFKNYEKCNSYLASVKSAGFNKASIAAFDKDGNHIDNQVALKAIENGVPPSVKIIDNDNSKKTNSQVSPKDKVAATEISSVSGAFFTIQIAWVDNTPTYSELKMLNPLYVEKDGNFYRYMYGKYSKLEDAKKQRNEIIKLGIKGAFVVEYQNGKRQE